MTQKDQDDVLFPEEIISWDEVVKLAVNLLIPLDIKQKALNALRED